MKKSISLILGVLIWSSCSKTSEDKMYTPQEAKRVLDSANAERIKSIQKESEKDLAIRREIELKPMIDSLKKQKHKK
ncbi:hypothetical protein D9M68_714300 [compost metagenome]